MHLPPRPLAELHTAAGTHPGGMACPGRYHSHLSDLHSCSFRTASPSLWQKVRDNLSTGQADILLPVCEDGQQTLFT